MNSQKHIINKQIIEIHLPQQANVQAIQQEISRRCREKWIPCINELCNRLTANGEQVRIENLAIDLGEISIDELEAVFAEKFAAALTAEKEKISVHSSQGEKAAQQQQPVELLGYYLATGALPWWAETNTREYLQQVLDQLLHTPDKALTLLLQLAAQEKDLLTRLVATFSAEQVIRCIQAAAPVPAALLTETNQALITFAGNNPALFAGTPAAHAITHTFLSVALTRALTDNDPGRLIAHAIQHTLQALGADMHQAVKYFTKKLSTHLTEPHAGNNITAAPPANIPHKQMQPAAATRLVKKWQTDFDNSDVITIYNAGLVLFWPFLKRFFDHLELISNRAFRDDEARNKAACVLQYLVNENEENLFEGQLVLNKVLCGINLLAPVYPEVLNEEEKVIVQGLLEAVIAQGPLWKNLSPAGFRTSYLQREGLLRTRDGHWLLQVKKETYDITLEKLPWSFTTVKLPWMNEILLVEWT